MPLAKPLPRPPHALLPPSYLLFLLAFPPFPFLFLPFSRHYLISRRLPLISSLAASPRFFVFIP